ncbi:hypothetical protein RhiirA5_504014 [Rhizophagus irregularis]|uniref:Uncharacterized protein n=1 Tax=Rhizophagus irregularis TaxID=588596 RepID=A0A2N0P6L2_9GLOM|nr:hypothetical protein RhiirA5_504014 [Rhizophagus irregularis]
METKFSKLNISDKVSDKDLKIPIQKTSWKEYLSFIEGIFGTAIKDSPRDLLLKRPFRSPKDFKNRIAFKDGVTFDSDEEYCYCQFFSIYKRKQMEKGKQKIDNPVIKLNSGHVIDRSLQYGINAKICRLSYAPFQKRKVPQTQ